MSTIRRNKKGEYKCWIPFCEDVAKICYSRREAKKYCDDCDCCDGERKLLRVFIRVEKIK